MSAVTKRLLFVRFGHEASSYEPQKWMLLLHGYPDTTIKTMEAERILRLPITRVGRSEHPNSLNIEILVSEEGLDGTCLELEQLFNGAEKVGPFTLSDTTPALKPVTRAPGQVISFPTSIAA